MNYSFATSRAEERWLERNLPEDVRLQPLLRALLTLIAEDEALRRQAVDRARAAARITDQEEEGQPGRQVGLGPDDYQKALREAGTVYGAARLLGVHNSTVGEMVERHHLHVPRPQVRRTRKTGGA